MLVVDKMVERSLGPNRFSRGCIEHESKHFPVFQTQQLIRGFYGLLI